MQGGKERPPNVGENRWGTRRDFFQRREERKLIFLNEKGSNGPLRPRGAQRHFHEEKRHQQRRPSSPEKKRDSGLAKRLAKAPMRGGQSTWQKRRRVRRLRAGGKKKEGQLPPPPKKKNHQGSQPHVVPGPTPTGGKGVRANT